MPHCHLTAESDWAWGPACEDSGIASSLPRTMASIAMRGSLYCYGSLCRYPGVLLRAHEVLSARRLTSTQTYSSAIVLTAEAPTKEIEFRLSPEASIIGVVLDEAGEPVRNAQVSLPNVPPPSPGGPQPVGQHARRSPVRMTGVCTSCQTLLRRVSADGACSTLVSAGRQSVARRVPTPILLAGLSPILSTWFPGVSDPALARR